jgi:cellobiose-specific phosphotransferase system component IIA
MQSGLSRELALKSTSNTKAQLYDQIPETIYRFEDQCKTAHNKQFKNVPINTSHVLSKFHVHRITTRDCATVC